MSRVSSSWMEQVKEWSVTDVAKRFGHEVLIRGVDSSFPCPQCKKTRRHTSGFDPRLAAKAMPAGRWWCEPCDAGGDTVTFAAAIVAGSPSPSKERWTEVRAACVALGLCTIEPVVAKPLSPKRETIAPPYAPAVEVNALWNACLPISAISDSGRYLSSRGFSLDRLAWAQMLRESPAVLPDSMGWWSGAWLRRWPLIFPAYDARGQLASLHARAAAAGIEPKTRWPYRCSASGLLFADSMGVNFLRSRAAGLSVAGLDAVVVAEGATDTLKLAQVVEGAEATVAVLGYVAGSKHAIAGIAWPADLPCIVATDDDAAGDRYAAEVRQSLDWRVPVYRARSPQERRSDGRKGGDWSDLSDADVLDAIFNDGKLEVCNG